MTLLDLGLLNRHWQKNPPLTVLVRGCAQALGVEFRVQEKPKPMTAEEARRFIAMTDGLRSF